MGTAFDQLLDATIQHLESLRAGGEPYLDEIVHPLAVVVTQDCDLIWDYKARNEPDLAARQRQANKLIPNVLLCQLWYADQLRGAQGIKSDVWRRLRGNLDERYHVLHEIPRECDQLGEGLPELAIDFKRVLAIPTEELYFRLGAPTKRRSLLLGLFMQDLSTRFGYYQLRVALPETSPKESASSAEPSPPTSP